MCLHTIILDPSNPKRMYIAISAAGAFRTDDGGATWNRVGPSKLWVAAWMTGNGSTIVASEATGNLVYVSYDYGATWTPINTGITTSEFSRAIREDPEKKGLLYAGTDDGNVWKSSNDGATWENLTAKLAPMLPNGGEVFVSRVEASKFDTNVVYVSFDNHRNGDFKPYLFVSKDGGKVWNVLGGNMPSVEVSDIQIHPRDHVIVIATYGRGMYVVDATKVRAVK